MKLKSLVMAGGRGTRLNLGIEKPMLRLNGIPMIDFVLSALRGASLIDEIFVAVSDHTPMTVRHLLTDAQARVIKTAGIGYHEDLAQALRSIGAFKCLTVSADLPALKPSDINFIAVEYAARRKPSLSVVAPAEEFRMMGIEPTSTIQLNGEEVVPCGINVIDGSRIGESYIDESMLVIHSPRFFVNINAIRDLDLLRAVEGLDFRIAERDRRALMRPPS